MYVLNKLDEFVNYRLSFRFVDLEDHHRPVFAYVLNKLDKFVNYRLSFRFVDLEDHHRPLFGVCFEQVRRVC